ncbi:putative heme-binding domain-containing protein [Anseongella ginsenosidimutans]|uniref:Putative heme-binding domain-containing protein n=1 Tax=Anseongella ginsenosidimutans TaxID=496056 RepID=A0A4R3KWG8_9SPHI|nr:HEAT repeat domain-containing protein [Anseongella ginsenosidimutans]QEC51346.1 c-type cytochrome [Anseongella ginsenosidimutans]TCS89955.1 putative heme-binding domain-containing protein [Anseongella ginsenosidimutans]
MLKYKNLFFALGLPLFLAAACNRGPADKRIVEMAPAAADSMARLIESRVKPELAEGLSISLWGVDSLVADPVAIHVDDRGRLWYTRTNRQKHSEFDIRGHRDWEIASIALETVEDKRAFLHKVLAPENSAQNQWLEDLNADSSHDWRDMTVEKEHVYRLEDRSGDGVADFSQLVVEDFHEEVTDVAGAVLSDGEDLYVGVGPDMWRMKDRNGDGLADSKESISHGYGVHIGFGGHGMSGLAKGPDGRIYWGIGDIGFNGVGPDGKKWKYPNQGVIVRANPDGSDFEVFAAGLRNTHEFVFDEYGNLISVDNDGDHPGEKERLVYIVNGSDAGWRINWQFGKYRDPDNNTYKVWMDEQMFKPRFEGQAAYIVPPISNYISGPAGMVYNPGTALGPEWKNTFFISEFVGNPARSAIHSFRLKPSGAGFELAGTQTVMKGILATGIDFGPDGALYIGDWIDGWNTKNYGRIWKMDAESGADRAERRETKALLGADFARFEPAKLAGLLANPDMRVRQKAQFELAKRGRDGVAVFRESISRTGNQLARIHGIWGISQMAREDSQHGRLLLPLLNDSDPEIRAQAAKWLGDIRFAEAGAALIPLLEDTSARARFFAAEALGRIAYEPAIQPIISLLAANDGKDVYIRHAGSLALARIRKTEPLAALASHPSRAVRIAAVVALRRMKSPELARFLSDQDEFIVTEAARAINDDHFIKEALPALANVLNEDRFREEALIRRAINACLWTGTEASMQNLIDYALREDAPAAMRAEAVDALSTWARPSVLDRVTGRYRGEVERDPALVQERSAEALLRLLSDEETGLRLSAANALGKLKISRGAPDLLVRLENDQASEVRVAALEALALLEYEQIGEAIARALSDPEKSVRIAGLDLLPEMNLPAEQKVSLLSGVIATKTSGEKQAALLTLGNLSAESTRPAFDRLLEQLAAGKIAPEIRLELAEAIDSTHSAELTEKLQAINAGLAPDTSMAAYAGLLFGGDVGKGRSILFSNQTAQCMRCHSIDDYGANIAPNLNGVASRNTREQLLESLIAPSARITPGYGFVTVELEGGKSLTGVLQRENDNSLTLKVGDEPDTLIYKKQVVRRTNAPSSMPVMKDILSKREIRDLVSFLATLKE